MARIASRVANIVSAKLQREPQHCELNIIGQKVFIQNILNVYKIGFQGYPGYIQDFRVLEGNSSNIF